jgi:serine/threonine protein kinase
MAHGARVHHALGCCAGVRLDRALIPTIGRMVAVADPRAFGRYVLLERIASGGMAEIYLAKVVGEAGFEKTCVLKRVHPHLVATQGFVEMFLDEARIAARLTHPGIVQIFDLGKEGDDYYIAMEYLAGEDLGTVIRQCLKIGKPMPIDVVLKIGSSAAEALHYAHELKDSSGKPLNIVHRDVSPSNLFATYWGGVKVLDFGIAHAEQRIQRTQAGQVKGKAAYMPPEQGLGKAVDRRADVWALGVCLHEMLTGHNLFFGINRMATLDAVRSARIPHPRESRPDVPEEIDSVVMSALERDPDKRFATAAALRDALERILQDRTYVPQTTQIGQFLRGVFGEQRAASRLALATAPPPEIAKVNTADIIVESRISTADGDIESAAAAMQTEALGPTRPDRVDFTAAISTPNTGSAWIAFTTRLSHSTASPSVRVGLIVIIALAAAAITFGTRFYAAGHRHPAAFPGVPSDAQARSEPAPEETPASPSAAVTGAPRLGSDTATPPLPTTAEKAPTAPSPVSTSASTVPDAVRRTGGTHSKPSFGWITAEATQPVSAALDGVSVGLLPVRRLKVRPGTHRLALDNSRLGLSRMVQVQVRAGEESVVKEVFAKGTLNVTADPWADVWVDDVKLGQTPLVREVWSGHHRVRLKGPGAEKTVAVEVLPGRAAVVNETLAP